MKMEERADAFVFLSSCVISLHLDKKICPTDLQREKQTQRRYRESKGCVHSHEVWTREFGALRHSGKC